MQTQRERINAQQMVSAPFYGRQAEVMRIYSRIGAQRPQSVSIVGDYQIGKSALLYYIAHPETRRQHLPSSESVVFVLLPLKEQLSLEPENFFAYVLDLVPDPPQNIGYEGFREVVLTLASQNRKLVLCMDDFDVITQSAAFPLRFFSFLRSLANSYPVAYLTTASEQLQKLCVSKDISESPFFNIFSSLLLKPLSSEDTMAFIQGFGEQHGTSLDSDLDFICMLAGGFPALLQRACALVAEIRTNVSGLSQSEQHIVAERFQVESSTFFRTTWESLTAREQEACRKLLHATQVSHREAYLLKKLTQKGYVATMDETYRLYSPAFAQFVKEVKHGE